MTTLFTAVSQISLGMVSVAMATGMSANVPVSDLTLEPSSLGADHVTLVNQSSGELNHSLNFELTPTKKTPRSNRVMASKSANLTPSPESPYEAWFNQYASQFGLNVDVLKKIAWCESHYHYDSVSSSGAYGGMYQFSASTWTSTRKAMGADPNPQLRFDPEQAILTAAFKIASGGIHAWPVCSTR